MKNMTGMLHQLYPGDWVEFRYGANRDVFYILEVDYAKEKITFCSTKWYVRDAETEGFECLETRNVILLGKGYIKKYWKYLPWRQFTCPFTKPKMVDTRKWWEK
jgi:hypothetical protein